MSKIIEKTMYLCPECNEPYSDVDRAERCLAVHIKGQGIREDFFENGMTLGQVWDKYSIGIDMPDECKDISKDNCFVVSYLQCCDYPAYQITDISPYGEIEVCGDGSWNGGYCSKVGFHNLKDPRPLKELWKYSNSGPFGRNKKATS